MIKVGNLLITQDTFADGTLKCDEPGLSSASISGTFDITWCYDNDAELFTVWCLNEYLRQAYHGIPRRLILPYIPNARQDRPVGGKLFTLKYFAKLINEMDFSVVEVVDPHSDVSLALFDRIHPIYNPFMVSYVGQTVMYPDAGAAKKYSSIEQIPGAIIGNKHRNYSGRIDSYELLNFQDGTKSVVIRDDICSYGGTFVAAAKELRSRGVENITLVVSHCENNILKGEVFDHIDRVFTTDSICTVEHPKLIIAKRYRS